MRALLALLLVAAVAQAQLYNMLFDSFEGKDADPCNYGLSWQGDGNALATTPGSIAALDCDTRPETSVTVQLPSRGGLYPVSPAVFDGTRLVTITGRSFPVTGTITVGLTVPGGHCGSDGVTAPALTVTRDATSTATQLIFRLPSEWLTVARELEVQPRRLCVRYEPVGNVVARPFQYTGFKIGVVWNCDDSVATMGCGARVATGAYSTLSAEQQAIRLAKTKCCRIGTAGANTLGLIGQCFNPNIESCCGTTTIDPIAERCCNPNRQITAFLNAPCPCDVATGMTAQSNCPVGESCCYPRKYSEFPLAAISTRVIGQCYNGNTHRCCDTGVRYDPGSQQCCVINGVQSVNLPCPCGADSDCTGGQFPVAQRSRTGLCCKQTAPAPLESLRVGSTPARQCSIYNNYPSGTGNLQQQPCLGACIDSRVHTCCNGAVCRTEFESCCNATCCNKFAGKCALAFRPGSPGNRWNWNDFTAQLPQGKTSYTTFQGYLPFEQCTLIEQLSPVKSFWIFVLPSMLILASFTLLALTLTFASKVSSHSYHPIEILLMGLAVLIAIFAIPCFFAPVYKYGVVMVLVASFTILVTSARSKLLNVILVAVYVIALVYLFDPFTGNAFFTLASARLTDGSVDPESSGILHATGKMFHNIPNTRDMQYCSNYYNYFVVDRQLRDLERWDNPEVPTFGYCARSWVMALLMIEGFLLIFTLVNFVVSLLALILRFKEDQGFDPIELEVRGQAEW